MTGLSDFLLARIAEDEAVANSCRVNSGAWRLATAVEGDDEVLAEGDDYVAGVASLHHGAHIARHDPARVLAECEAKRALITVLSDVEWTGSYAVRDVALGLLARPYADHPDYREEWKP